MTYDELRAKVEARMTDADKKASEPAIDDAVRWFVAVKMAEDFLDSNGLRDVAHLVLDGNAISGPVDRAFVEGWIQDGNDDGDAWDWLDKVLDRHFGV